MKNGCFSSEIWWVWRLLEKLRVWVRVYGVWCWKKREDGRLGVFEFERKWKKREKLRVFNPYLTFMSRHRFSMPRHDLKIFTIYLAYAAAWIIHAAAWWIRAVFSSSGHAAAYCSWIFEWGSSCRSMTKSCRGMLLSVFSVMSSSCRSMMCIFYLCPISSSLHLQSML